jgi:hemoglobin
MATSPLPRVARQSPEKPMPFRLQVPQLSKDDMMPIEISGSDIARLVPAFYVRIREDAVLGPIFTGAINDWPHHLDKLQAFWSSVLLTSGQYKGQPMVAHLRHERHMTAENFARWLDLWRQTTVELLPPETAAVCEEKANRIAESLQLGVQYYRERNAT